ncbi:hypothetical protein DIPPA_17076 [Diplonema papillatum]|nr:hypothetical protein DIPPA_17076 [Diplonema papillatum]
MAQMAMLCGPVDNQDTMGLAGVNSPESKKRSVRPTGVGKEGETAPWNKRQDLHKRGKVEVRRPAAGGGAEKAVRKPVAGPAREARAPWDKGTRAGGGKKSHQAMPETPRREHRTGKKTTAGGEEEGSGPKPWEKDQAETHSKRRNDPFAASPQRSKTTDVLLHCDGEEQCPAEGGRRVFAGKVGTSSHMAGPACEPQEGFTHGFITTDGYEDPSVKSGKHFNAPKERSQSPWTRADLESEQKNGKHIDRDARQHDRAQHANLLTSDGPAAKTTGKAHGPRQGYSQLWGFAQNIRQKASPERSVAPWDKESAFGVSRDAKVFFKSAVPAAAAAPGRTAAPWERSNKAHKTGVSTSVRRQSNLEQVWQSASYPRPVHAPPSIAASSAAGSRPAPSAPPASARSLRHF